jgi:hypothetical protein
MDNRGTKNGKEVLDLKGCCPNSNSPAANIKEFLVTILVEAKEEQFPLFELKRALDWSKSIFKEQSPFEQEPVKA